MQLDTYTSIWKTKRVFYKIEDVRLPVPVPADVLLLTAVCFAVWDGIWALTIGVAPFQMMFGTGWFAVAACWYVLPPFFTARLISRPNREGKNALQVVASRSRYLARPRTFDGFVSRRHTTIWVRTHRQAPPGVTQRTAGSGSRRKVTRGTKSPRRAQIMVSTDGDPKVRESTAQIIPPPSHASKHRAGSAPGRRRRP